MQNEVNVLSYLKTNKFNNSILYQLLINNIENRIQLTENEKELFLSYLTDKKIKRRDFFIKEGEPNTSIAFVLSGCMRSYKMDQNGHEHILQFAIEDWWISDVTSFVDQKPGDIAIDAIENSHLALLPRDAQLELFDRCPKFERYFRILSEIGIATYQKRILENISLTATERYENFAKRYPFFVQRLPQNQIAAYLGITPEFLSKIRHQNMQKKY
ncbi:MAG: Crp/Fnr family transcriptional regulator [Bacteroidota bacterium]